MNNFKDGTISLDNEDISIMYKPNAINNLYFCVALESKGEYKYGQTFYFDKKFIK